MPASEPAKSLKTGPRPRGRCPECGRDCALTSDGTVWGHSRYESGQYQQCGEGAAPMTAEQAARYDEAERARIAAQQRAWERREQEREQEEQGRRLEELIYTRLAFRRFDDESFAACPWRSPAVALIALADDGPVTFACHPERKLDLLRSEFTILAAWPGRWSQHIFLLTEQEKKAVIAAIA